MTEAWQDVLSELGIAHEPTSPPEGERGDWAQTLARFATRGFLRVVIGGDEDTDAVVEVAAPGNPSVLGPALRTAFENLSGAEWKMSPEGPPWALRGRLPADADELRNFFIAMLKLADSLERDDQDEILAILHGFGQTPGEEEEDAERTPDEAQAREETEETIEPKASASSSPFERIGADAPSVPAPDSAVAFDCKTSRGGIDVALGVDEALPEDERAALLRALQKNLRGKFDVDARASGPDASDAAIASSYATRLYLRLEPVHIVGDASSPDDLAARVRGYFETLADLARQGIAPSVFLGVRTSSRERQREKRQRSPALEAIGTTSHARGEALTSLVVDDEPPRRRSRDEPDETTGVTLGLVATPGDGEPLQAGQFEDPRLRRPDATTSLVDVVLRHPGYSDRRIGQVLSILLSIEYHRALEIAQQSPTVIAWGVSRDRGQTMKTVIEGAGGKILLVEPETFPAS